jgi:anti-anti-sigma factor
VHDFSRRTYVRQKEPDVSLTQLTFYPRSPDPDAAFRCIVVACSGLARVKVSGEIDIAAAPALATALATAAHDAEQVIVDLSDVTFIDSTGLHVILTAQDELRQSSARLVLIPGPSQVQRLFEITGVANRLEFATDPGDPEADAALCP